MPDLCGHSVSIGTCDLEAGHPRGHWDQEKGKQWFDRASDYGPGAFASITPGDEAWKHPLGSCRHYPWKRVREGDKVTDCATCLQIRYALLAEAVGWVLETVEETEGSWHEELERKFEQATRVEDLPAKPRFL